MTDSPPRLGRRHLLLAALAPLCAPAARAQPARADRFFTTSDNLRIHYVEAGRGRTILFVPGWSMPAFIFDPQIAALSRNWRVVAMDPRSQGQSEIARSGHEPARRGRDIAEMIARLGAERVVLVGWSLGVLDSLAYLHAYGDRHLAGLVLVDNSVGEGTPPPARPGTFIPNLRRNRETTLRGFVRSMYATPQDPAYLEAVTRAALRTPLEAQVQLLSYPRPREFWRDAVYSTRRPVLYLIRPRFAEQGALLQHNHADATTVIFDRAGHALFVDEADRFNALVENFCATRARWS